VLSAGWWRHHHIPTTAVFCCLCWIWTPLSCWFRWWSRGFRHKTNKVILSGHPCRTELRIWIGPDICPFIWTAEVAFVYMCFIPSMKASLNPWLFSMVTRYVCDIFFSFNLLAPEFYI
jgi:hypothetical protein